jgi:hypothetical protein
MSIPRFFIYALLDPDTYETRYIGQSAQGISRLNFTMNKSSLKIDSPKTKWIHSLLEKNKIPLFKIIDVCEFQELNQKEVFWISKHDKLLNVAKGGIGGDTGKSFRNWKPVISKNIENGKTKEYRYVWEVLKDGFSPTKVSAVCLGKRKSHKGHYFAHNINEFDVIDFKKPVFKTKKAVLCKSTQTGEVMSFDSIKEAAKYTGLCVTTISNSVRGKSKCRQYNFEYATKAM